ncbi:MAG: ATP-dependent helicase [Clostridium sp.]|jgi:DNA helicase-2/ATP-dependent DNA helicase PcrA|nr:ATP-dependent helicase [Clostridium sp.]
MPPNNTLSAAQSAAAAFVRGPALVLAGPGSGKTHTIMARIQNLITNHAIPPQRIIAVTFTKAAALSMAKRFPQTTYGSPIFCTFHSLFYQILRKSNVLPASSNLLRYSEQKSILLPILRQSAKERSLGFVQPEETETLLLAFSHYKNSLSKDTAAKLLPPIWKPHFENLFAAYEKERIRRRRVDFDDMAYECKQLFASQQTLLASWQQQFEFFLVDEFQDINPIQYELLRLLCSSHRNLFVVGDDDQSIYGFRGSDPSFMHKFMEDYHAQTFYLETNYRSRPEIVDASVRVISQNPNRFVKNLHAAKPSLSSSYVLNIDSLRTENNIPPFESNGFSSLASNTVSSPKTVPSSPCESCFDTFKYRQFTSREEQTTYLANRFRALPSHELQNCAVLFRTNYLMQSLLSKLYFEGIPYHCKEKVHFLYDHFIMKDLRAYFDFAHGNHSREVFLKIMNKPSRGIAREALYDETIDLAMLKKRCGRDISKTELWDRLERGFRLLKEMSPMMGINYILKAMGYERYLKEKLHNNLSQYTAGSSPISNISKNIDDHTNNASVLHETWMQWMDILAFFKAESARYKSCDEWFAAQTSMKETSKSQEGVSIMTVHASKGLEFDHVFLPDVNEGVYPHGYLPDATGTQEECRLLYVGMTRAKESLELLWVAGYDESANYPSRFMQALINKTPTLLAT